MKRLVLGLGLVALAVISAACSGGSGASPSAPAASAPAASAPAGDAITVSAKDLKFSTASITAPADEAFQIVFDNQEGVPHNIAIKDAAGAEKFKGEIVTSTTITYDVPALAAGAYEFWCEVHPDMKGTLTAG
ncbi:MAG: copper-binding protein [Chloroflexota bacterium]|jgi:plastocyanin|nr:copper-binding protein [Chloroflexota bacterium]